MKKRIAFFLFCLTSFLLTGTNQKLCAQVSESDSLALVALYKSTNGYNWTNNTNWLTGPVHTWYGVATTCTEWDTNGVCVARIVVSLHLYENQLIGSIPPEIGNLTSLRYLDLGFNQLTGSIPPEIGNLTNLRDLDLGLNQLTGSIPPEIGNLTNLSSLWLEYNQLTGNIPPEIGNLTSLAYLYLWDNQLTGNIPPGIGHLTSLWSLYLCSNQLTGNIPPEIGNLTSLAYLRLGCNQLTGNIPPEIGNLTNLSQLCLSLNQLTGNIPPEIGNLTSLSSLDLVSNQLTGNIPPEIGNLTSLEHLYVGANQLTGNIPPEIGNLTSLANLRLYYNQLTGNIPPEIGNLTNLGYLVLSDNQLTGNIPPEIGNLTNLSSLDLASNQLTGNIPPEIWNLTNLSSLLLSGNQLTGNIPPEIGNLTNLWGLGLSGNQLTGNIPPEIGNLTNLSSLSLGFNHLTGNIPPEIGNLTNLSSLDLGSNQLTGNIPPEIGNLTNLSSLWLEYNQLTGNIPPEIGNLTSLEHLYVGANQLTGNIPPEIGNLTNLSQLSISSNQLIGNIPPEIVNLTSLWLLYINDNSFVDLPDLSPIPTLQFLWIEDNQFTFEDIEPNVGVPNDIFRYSPQDSVGSTRDTTVSLGDSLTLSVSVGGTANLYQWTKDGGYILGANDSLYTIDTVTFADSGSYICRITNTIATELTLYSRPINVTLQAPAVILIHGITGDFSSFGGSGPPNLKSLLEENGRSVKYFSYPSSNLGDWKVPLETLASHLDDSLMSWNDSLRIEDIGVDIIAHSMGGLISRYYIAHPGQFALADQVKKLITLGTPNYGAAAALWADLLPGTIQGTQMKFASQFLWDLHQAWSGGSFETDVLCIAGAKDGYNDPHDGIVLLPSASLENLGYPVCYIPNNHGGEGGMAYITDVNHPSYIAINSFLSGEIPQSNEESVSHLTEGMLIVGLFDASGEPVDVGTFPLTGLPRVWWHPNPTLYWAWPWWPWLSSFGYGVNPSSGKYYATGADAASYEIDIYPSGGYSPVINYPVIIEPRQTEILSLTVYSADESAIETFAGGDTPPATFGNTDVTMDFSSGPGGDVSVYRFDDDPPAVDSATLPHYWDIDSDFSDSSFLVTITFDYDESEVLAAGLSEEYLKVAYYDTLWNPMTTDIDQDNNQISVSTDHFSLFGIGSFPTSDVEEEQEFTSSYFSFSLSQNYPNPFNPTTNIKYYLPKTSKVVLRIYNTLGQEVRTLFNGIQTAGAKSVIWDGKDNLGQLVSSAVYLCTLKVGNERQTKKMLLLR